MGRCEQGSGGKLKEAARVWATGGTADLNSAVADAEAQGLPELAERLRKAASQQSGFKVWRRNWGTLLAFLAVSSQWRAIATANGAVYWQGLDYTAALASLKAEGVNVTPSLWKGVRVMERAARDALNGMQG